ncbi:hypothetical protein Sango_1151400 [Sesamum angolense]|uniref:Uncharacterized protein n=1 Tax=Sesamum angolense TaxID=2727404 RepID=A0AAE1WWA2_9LAMI|nr:hypothetical protein Sango_1151400 [Sesamum angolense]
MIKWTVELSEYDISYQPRTTIKAQTLVEFMAETTPAEKEGKSLLHVDGSSTYSGSGARVVLTSRESDELEFFLRFDFKASNNKAE